MSEPEQRQEQEGQNTARPLSEAERREAIRVHWDWLQFIAMCGGFGITLGVVLATLVVHADVSGIGSMLANSPDAIGYKLLLAGGLASTFGMVSMGIGIMVRSQYF